MEERGEQVEEIARCAYLVVVLELQGSRADVVQPFQDWFKDFESGWADSKRTGFDRKFLSGGRNAEEGRWHR